METKACLAFCGIFSSDSSGSAITIEPRMKQRFVSRKKSQIVFRYIRMTSLHSYTFSDSEMWSLYIGTFGDSIR